MFRFILTLLIILTSIMNVEAKTVRVGTLDIPNFFTIDGRSGGYAYDYLTDFKEHTDWQYEFLEGDFPTQLDRLRRGEIDILPLVTGSPENRAEFLFPDIPMAHYLTLLCVLPDKNGETKINTSTPRIGYIDRYVNYHAMMGYCEEHHLKPILTSYKTKDELHHALRSGEVDAIVINSFCYDQKETTISVLSFDPAYFAINPNRSDLQHEMNHAQLNIHAAAAMYEDKLYQNYYEGFLNYNQGLDDSEKEFIREKRVLSAAIIDGFAPIMYWDSVDSPQGVAVETLEAISERFFLPIKFIYAKNIDMAREMLLKGDVDIIASKFGTIESPESVNVIATKSFFPAIQSRVVAKDFHLKDDEIAIYAVDKLTKNMDSLPPNALIFETQEQAIEAVYSGKAQIALGSFYVQQNLIDKPKFRKLICTPSKTSGKGISFLVARDSDPRLLSILNKGIIARSETDTLRTLYQGTAATSVISITDELIYESPGKTVAALIALLILVCLAFSSFHFMNRRKLLADQLAEKEEYEERLQIALDNEQRASQAKSDFLARMTHEIRTPINAILGFNKMIEENPHNESALPTWHRKIELAGKHLLQLVNDILDISKLNSGQIQLEPKEVSMSEMMEQIDTVYTELARERKIELNFEHPNENYIFIADELRLKQILINIISNALKYNHCGGSVTVSLQRLDDSEDKLRIKYSIRDTGIGIDPENLKNIFHEFERTKHSNEHWIEGAGLGLAISSKLARLMNTEIHVESEVGVGSNFWIEFEFPLVRVEQEEEILDDDTPPNCEGRHVLVAEDNELNAELITYILEEMNAQVDLAENGKIACEKFADSPEGFYSFVIMDIMMPVMSGYEATRKIRRLPRQDAEKIPIIALSANSFDEDRAKSIEAGMSNHCAKPIDPSEFYSAIRKAIAA